MQVPRPTLQNLASSSSLQKDLGICIFTQQEMGPQMILKQVICGLHLATLAHLWLKLYL